MTDHQVEEESNGIFAIMWDCTGLEAVKRFPDASLTTWALLQNKPPPNRPNLNMWALRARYNSQRHYEIYVITATAGITETDIVDMFEADPQSAADTIRRIGQKFYSDRTEKNQVVIQ